MRRLIIRWQARADRRRGARLRRRVGTHLLEEMPRHPERIRALADPVAAAEYADIAEELLDDGLAEIVEETGWAR